MPHIRRQGKHVTTDVVATIGTRFQGTRRKGMAQIHEPWSRTIRRSGNTGSLRSVKGIKDRVIAQRAPPRDTNR